MATKAQTWLALIPQIIETLPPDIREEGTAIFVARGSTSLEIDRLGKCNYVALDSTSGPHFTEMALTAPGQASFGCSCKPLDEALCPHVVALLLATQREYQEREAAKKKKPKKKTFRKRLEEMAPDLTKEDLLEFVLAASKHNAAFQNKFMTHFIDRQPGAQKDAYRDLIEKWMAKAMQQPDRFRDGTGSKLLKPVRDLLRKAREELKSNRVGEVFAICLPVVEILPAGQEFAPRKESNQLYKLTEDAVEMLGEIPRRLKTPLQKEEFFEGFLESAGGKLKNWTLGPRVMGFAEQLILDAPMRNAYEAALDRLVAGDKFPGAQDSWVSYQFTYLVRQDRKQEALDLLAQQVDNYGLQEQHFALAMELQDLDRARSLINSRIRLTGGSLDVVWSGYYKALLGAEEQSG